MFPRHFGMEPLSSGSETSHSEDYILKMCKVEVSVLSIKNVEITGV